MSQDVNELSKQPTPDKAEDNAFFPSPYSLSQYTAPKTDLMVLNTKVPIKTVNGKY
ncbi:Chaperone protein hchA [Staphylococcus aureus]|nr:Chaperone protein hchA [Staphylococcus aureus]